MMNSEIEELLNKTFAAASNGLMGDAAATAAIADVLALAFVALGTLDQTVSESVVPVPATAPATGRIGGVAFDGQDTGGNAGDLTSLANEFQPQIEGAAPAGQGNPNDTIGAAFDAVSGAAGAQLPGVDSGAPEIAASAIFNPASEVFPSQTPAGTANQTGAVAANSSGGGFSVEKTIATVLEGGLGVIPLVNSLIQLFGGGSTAAPPPLEKYSLPSPISFAAAETEDGLAASDYDQTGVARLYGNVTGGVPAAPVAAAATGDSAGASAANSGAAQQITVNVQAMDARSFMDYSAQIAQAVRDAMLNSSSINDVISEL